MFDISWPELFVVAAIAVLVVGPKDIPGIMRNLGRVVRRVQYVRYAFSQQFEDFMKEHDLEELRKSVSVDPAPESKIEDEIDADEDVPPVKVAKK